MSDGRHLVLEVATPTGMQLQVKAESVSAPSVHGEFTVLPGHLPLLAAVRSGILKYVVRNQMHVAAIGPGFVEAEPDQVELLTDLFALAAEIDVPQVTEELRQAEAALKACSAPLDTSTYQELQRDLDWAHAKLDAKAAAANL